MNINENQGLHCIVCSDSKEALEYFVNKGQQFTPHNETAIQDLFILSQCNQIIGNQMSAFCK
jgi:hypothetical protein